MFVADNNRIELTPQLSLFFLSILFTYLQHGRAKPYANVTCIYSTRLIRVISSCLT